MTEGPSRGEARKGEREEGGPVHKGQPTNQTIFLHVKVRIAKGGRSIKPIKTQENRGSNEPGDMQLLGPERHMRPTWNRPQRSK